MSKLNFKIKIINTYIKPGKGVFNKRTNYAINDATAKSKTSECCVINEIT